MKNQSSRGGFKKRQCPVFIDFLFVYRIGFVMKTSSFFCTVWKKIKGQSLIAILLVGLFYPSTVNAQITPTPDPDNAILIVVQPNDSLWSIAAAARISLDQLLTLNDLTETAVIQPGEQLIVGYSDPEPTATATQPAPTITPTRPPPPPTETAVPPPPTGVCLLAFNDMNQDGVHDAGEPLKTAVAFTLFNENSVVANYVTDGISEPYCLTNLVEGTYQVTRSIGENETLTTPGDRGIVVQLGEMVDLTFGSVEGSLDAQLSTPVVAEIGNGIDSEETALFSPAAPAKSTSPFQQPLVIGLSVLLLLLLSTIFLIIRWQSLVEKKR